MLEALGFACLVLLVIAIALLVSVLVRGTNGSLGRAVMRLQNGQDRSERLLREEMERGRD